MKNDNDNENTRRVNEELKNNDDQGKEKGATDKHKNTNSNVRLRFKGGYGLKPKGNVQLHPPVFSNSQKQTKKVKQESKEKEK